MKTMIKGTPIKLLVTTQTGIDPFHKPIFNEEWVTIDNVLIGEPNTDDVINEMNLSGKRIAYTLAIPKGDTNDWTNKQVQFFGQTFKTVGIPTQGIDENIPLLWNKKVKVYSYEQDETT